MIAQELKQLLEQLGESIAGTGTFVVLCISIFIYFAEFGANKLLEQVKSLSLVVHLIML